MTAFGIHAGLFALAFLAGSVLPAQSELGLAALLAAGDHAAWTLLATASLGNTLGAVVNWVLGRGIDRLHDRKWFPASEAQLERAARWYSRWGRWSLLLSWMPVGGDALTVVAGVLREPLPSFLALVAIAKTARYLVVAAFVLSWF
ncbi:YqaA family protein [Oricola thermophila]|uniref:DedA family protein n=1 Tax=Oricola thermophila TaxID=2742145 RepID=A0A6N1VC61_9HYPH|nr:YqaA family protein [Oricola thermophila]QKV18470.1 DedA family protein [Oricola thermophila]